MRKFLLATIAIGLGACASAPTAGDQPGLTVPPPPAHVVPITPEPVVEPVGEIPAPPSTTAPAGRGSARGTRESPPKPGAGDARTDTKPGETKPDQPAQPDTPPVAAPVAPPPPAPQLRTAESSGAESNVRGTIERARNLLNGVDYRRLTRARQKAYDDAKAFAQQADDALKVGNVAFAQGVATKAETLAKDLAGR
jgi:hypothetical protein